MGNRVQQEIACGTEPTGKLRRRFYKRASRNEAEARQSLDRIDNS